MYEIQTDVVIVGGGPAGLSAAVAAKKEGAEKVLIIERDEKLGGILQQCIHPGFGLTYFHKELTGPEYAGHFKEEALALGAEVLLNSMVLEVIPEESAVICVNSEYGMTKVKAGSIVLAMGCRERTRAGIMIPGTRPAGVYTAGAAQRLVNRQNAVVGKNIVILGSGDIGMIMARRMTLEGAHVIAVVELMDFLAGLTRNKVQCLDDFGIPLKLSHTVTRIVGNERVEGVYIAQVDKDKKPIPETEEFIPCDTLLLSVGLIPENELSRGADVKISRITNGPEVNQYMQTSWDNVFACGNVVHVNDLVDNVTVESMNAGASAARYAMHKLPEANREVPSVTGENVRYLCPQRVKIGEENETVRLFFRVLHPELDVVIRVKSGDKVLSEKKAKRVNPGEMCHVEVKTAEITGDDVMVEVVK
ncbi:FAD-dependent oxidoreductase [Clostridium sp. AF37-5AT]|jgi:thioredoxin reductase|nr:MULTISPECIES: NAD(P)/FAD-dependent oxidoreductase [unclassified Clostridium]RHO02430.1 FAD-dependent oxidoreductase [Clostridium sp. AM22-16AC]RHO37862.1 FAD-dependent oxidoreductase [Clostridium sp. AM16-23]RHO95713.1 FAD-dependent oxidoreductase [Clostridium sp. AF37-5AT]